MHYFVYKFGKNKNGQTLQLEVGKVKIRMTNNLVIPVQILLPSIDHFDKHLPATHASDVDSIQTTYEPMDMR